MKKYRLLVLYILLTLVSNVHSQGLQFKGNQFLIEERTSYNVFKNTEPTFKDLLHLSFDFLPDNSNQSGYLFRIKTQDPSFTLNLSYNSKGDTIVYKLNEEGRSTLLSFTLDKREIAPNNWSKVWLKLDLIENAINFGIDNKSAKYNIALPGVLKPKIHFGKSDYFIDLPSFSIKNLYIGDSKQKYEFEFDEYKGNIIHNIKGEEIGFVDNPTWLINESYYWEHLATYGSSTVAGFNYDSIQKNIFYFNRDSIISYNLTNKETHIDKYTNECPIALNLGYNFFNSLDSSLYAYEVATPLAEDVSIAKYDLYKKTWSTIGKESLPRQLYHHGKFFDEKNNRIIIFGGFGQMRYNDEFNSYNLDTNNWEKLKFSGDTIFPRYFLSMGHDRETNHLYIFGGMGNESGEYNVGRRYFYDFYRVDLNTMHISKLWEIPWEEDFVVPVKNMLLDDSTFTTLCYPEHFTESYLRLYQFSLKDGAYSVLGDSIPIRSEKITTNANLFYNKEMAKYYSVIQEFDDDDKASTLRVYSLTSPAISKAALSAASTNGSLNTTIIWWASLAIILVALYILSNSFQRRIKRKKNKLNSSSHSAMIEEIREIRKNSIYIFGEFCVTDKNGKDITYMFSTRLKQAFLLILQHSVHDGISTQQLTNSLWSDRTSDRAKNIRGVTISDLRKILEELDDIQLIYQKSRYKLVLTGSSYCDYLECINLVSNKEEKIDITAFCKVIARGKFLKDEEDQIFDSLKSSLEHSVEPSLKQFIQQSYNSEDLNFCILLCEAMFNIDPLNEFSISFLIRSMESLDMTSDAQKRFLRFEEEYRKMIGEEFPKTYKEVREI